MLLGGTGFQPVCLYLHRLEAGATQESFRLIVSPRYFRCTPPEVRQYNAGRDDGDAFGRYVSPRFGGEVFVPGNDKIASLDGASKAAAAARVVEAFGRMRIAQPDGIVEVEEKPWNALAEAANCQGRQQLPLKDHGIVRRQAAAQVQAGEPRLRSWKEVERMPGSG
jgi:hypothetical protein